MPCDRQVEKTISVTNRTYESKHSILQDAVTSRCFHLFLWAVFDVLWQESPKSFECEQCIPSALSFAIYKNIPSPASRQIMKWLEDQVRPRLLHNTACIHPHPNKHWVIGRPWAGFSATLRQDMSADTWRKCKSRETDKGRKRKNKRKWVSTARLPAVSCIQRPK